MKLIGIKKCLFLLLLVGFLGNGFLLGMNPSEPVDMNSSRDRPDTQGFPLRECKEFVASLEKQGVKVLLGLTEDDDCIWITPSTFHRTRQILSGQLENKGPVYCPRLVLSGFRTMNRRCASLLSGVFTGVERLMLHAPGHFRQSRVALQLFFNSCPSIKEVTIYDVEKHGLRLFTLRHCIPKNLDRLAFTSPSDLLRLVRNSHVKYTRLVRHLIKLAPKTLVLQKSAWRQQHVDAIQAAGIPVKFFEEE